MGFFGSSKKETCYFCNKEVSVSGFLGFSGGYKIEEKIICKECAEKYGFDPRNSSGVTVGAIENIINSENILGRHEFNPVRKVYRTNLFGANTPDSLLEVDEAAGLVNIPTLFYTGVTSFKIIPNLMPINTILNFELQEDGNTVTDGSSLLGAGVGGVLFGGAGAIVGAGVGGKTSKKVCKSMKIKVTFNNMANPIAYIDLLGRQNNGAKTDSAEYKGAFAAAQECMSILCVLMENNKKNNTESTQPTQSQPSVADELLKFKQLLDMGVLTQEEFDAKKKELLNL